MTSTSPALTASPSETTTSATVPPAAAETMTVPVLTTVTERTTEIGLKKALGAIPWQIQIQFLIESFLLSIIGGILGVFLGLTLSYTLCKVIGMTFFISTDAIILGVTFSAAVGIIFGWAPARKASKLNPIDALRAV